MTKIKASEKFILLLKEYGMKSVFGIPGAPFSKYLEFIKKHKVDNVLTANETGAAIMADVTARLTGTPGVCYATYGPGATNLATGIGGAYLDNSPVIALTSEFDSKYSNRNIQMMINHQKLFQPITKWTTSANTKNINGTIHKAYSIALSEKPGPVHIGLSNEFSNAQCQEKIVRDKLNIATSIIEKDSDNFNDVIKLLKKSNNPLIVLGNTARRIVQKNILHKLAEKFNAPVIITPMSKGVFDENHNLFVGVFYHALSSNLDSIFKNTDLVIAIGYDTVEYNYESWLPKNIPIVNINTSNCDIEKNYTKVINITSNINDTLLLLSKEKYKSVWDNFLIDNVKKQISDCLLPAKNHFGPVEAFNIIKENSDDNTILTVDVGAHTHLAGQFWKPKFNDSFIMTNGWSSMGFSVPAGIAAKYVFPNRKVISVSGDGGFTMTAGEVITARRLNLNVIFIVLCDKSLSLIRIKQSRNNIKKVGVDLYNNTLFCADTFLGLPVFQANNSKQMNDAIKKCSNLKTSSIIEVNVDTNDYDKILSCK